MDHALKDEDYVQNLLGACALPQPYIVELNLAVQEKRLCFFWSFFNGKRLTKSENADWLHAIKGYAQGDEHDTRTHTLRSV